MKTTNALVFAIMLVAAPLSAQVPNWPNDGVARYIVHADGYILYVPDTHEVVVQPKGANTAPFSWDNYLGIKDNKWPLLEAICSTFPRYSAGGPVEDTPEVCKGLGPVVRTEGEF